MYLRETKRRNRDGSTVAYLQLAHSERHPVTGVPSAKVIHNFGRADTVDRVALARLVASISRFLEPEQAITAAPAAEIEVLDSRRLGAAWVLGRLWERLGIGAALRRIADGRRLDGDAVERVLFALVAQRALEPGSKLAATGWVAERVAIEHCAGFSDDAAYRAMDFLLDALGEIAAQIFASVAHLLNLDVDIVFVDTTSTYWEVEVADELAELGDDDPAGDDAVGKPVENGARRFGKSKDHRDDLPQVVIAMAVTRDGIPVRCWTFPGSESDQRIIRTVKDDLGSWNLHRLVWVADRGFASAANRAYLTRGGGHYIHAEKLRHTNTEAAAALARAGRYRPVAGNLRVKEVRVSPGGGADDGARAERFVVCHNPDAAAHDEAVRDRLIEHLQGRLEGSDTWPSSKRDELVGSLKQKPGCPRTT
ncbi:MAG: IS1634 family transposase [Haloechinothrix sp.]